MLKIKILSPIIDFCHKDCAGNDTGYLVRVCDKVFVDKLKLRVIYSYYDVAEDSRFDCIIDKRKEFYKKNIFQYSPMLFDTIDIYRIKKKNSNNQKPMRGSKNQIRRGAIRHGVLFYWMKEEERKTMSFYDSSLALINMLDLGKIDEIIIFKDYLSEFNYFLNIEKKSNSEYIYELIENYPIEPIYLIFNYKVEWLLAYLRPYIPFSLLM